MKSHLLPYALLLVALLTAPFLGVYPVFLMKLLCFALFASAFNLLLGFSGLLSLGHASFFGGSAYVAGYLVKALGLTPELGLVAGTLAGALLGLCFGVLAVRREGLYFAMITLALAQLVFFIAVQARFTGGEDGLQGVPRGKLFGAIDLTSDLTMYYFVLLVVVMCFLFIVRIVHSPFGQVLKGIRENEARALSLGYDPARVKLMAFVLSAALSGLAGSLKTLVLGFATLTDVHWSASGQVVLMTLIGGLGTISGPLVGATITLLLENKLGELGGLLVRLTSVEWFGTLGESITMVTGLVFMVCVLVFRRGIMGELIALRERRASMRSLSAIKGEEVSRPLNSSNISPLNEARRH
jgi:branched-chain amino acid transport system permease protein